MQQTTDVPRDTIETRPFAWRILSLIGVLLVGLAVVIGVLLEPTALYGMALGAFLLCVILLGFAFVARRRPPRAEPPEPHQVIRWLEEVERSPSEQRVESLLLRLGRWPHLLDDLGQATCERVRRLVVESGADRSLLAWVEQADPRPRHIGALHVIGWLHLPQASEKLTAGLHQADADRRYAAAAALMRLGTADAYGVILSAIGTGIVPDSRLAALLEQAEPDLLIPVLSAHARDANMARRFWAAHLAGRARSAGALRLLLQLADDESEDVRANAAESLGRLGAQDARERLHAMLSDPSWVVQSHAASALGDLGPAPSLERLAGMLDSPHWWVRQNALRALQGASPTHDAST